MENELLKAEFALFTAFPKIPRLHGACIITEKIDGTNACIEFARGEGVYIMAACSRNRRLVTIHWRSEEKPEVTWHAGDNYGFGAWVVENFLQLRGLGYGRHFGEWWGKGIQRGYGLEERRFSNFRESNPCGGLVSTVPLLNVLAGFHTFDLEMAMERLRVNGSLAAPGFMDPEGIVVFHERSGQLFKLTYEAGPKGQKEES